jgi:hypothetical protein
MSIQWLCPRHNSLLLALIVVAFLYIAMPAYSQKLPFGVKVGGQVTKNPFTSPYFANVIHENRVLYGPMAELRLPRHLAVEVDALYKRKVNYTQNFIYPDATMFRENFYTTDVTSWSWEIPVVTKWRVLERRYSVFVGGGFSSRQVSGTNHTYGTSVSLLGFPPMTFDSRTSLPNPWTHGPVFTAGIEARAGVFHFQPELRCTRWNDSL